MTEKYLYCISFRGALSWLLWMYSFEAARILHNIPGSLHGEEKGNYLPKYLPFWVKSFLSWRFWFIWTSLTHTHTHTLEWMNEKVNHKGTNIRDEYISLVIYSLWLNPLNSKRNIITFLSERSGHWSIWRTANEMFIAIGH